MKTPFEEAMTAVLILLVIGTVIVTGTVFGLLWWLLH